MKIAYTGGDLCLGILIEGRKSPSLCHQFCGGLLFAIVVFGMNLNFPFTDKTFPTSRQDFTTWRVIRDRVRIKRSAVFPDNIFQGHRGTVGSPVKFKMIEFVSSSLENLSY